MIISTNNASTDNARRRRIYRARSAAYLATLDSNCSADELLTLDWEALESVPHWCFLSASSKLQLQRICGGLFLAPMVQRWIDGRRIQSLRALLGDSVFHYVLSYQINAATDTEGAAQIIPAIEESQVPDTTEMLEGAGTAVLLAAVQHPLIARLLGSRYDTTTGAANAAPSPLAAAIAQPLYNDAVTLFEQLQATAESAANTAKSEQPA